MMHQQTGTARARPILTSLPLQIALYFGGWWSAAFWLATAALFVFKGLTLPYPRGRFAAEFAFVWLWLLVEPARIFLASKGNKTERPGPLLVSLALAGPQAAFVAYYLRYQTFVCASAWAGPALKADVLLLAASAAFLGVQGLLGAWSALRFAAALRVV